MAMESVSLDIVRGNISQSLQGLSEEELQRVSLFVEIMKGKIAGMHEKVYDIPVEMLESLVRYALEGTYKDKVYSTEQMMSLIDRGRKFSDRVAKQVSKKIFEKVSLLRDNPLLGKVVPSNVFGGSIRYLVVRNEVKFFMCWEKTRYIFS